MNNLQERLLWAIEGHYFELTKRLVEKKGAVIERDKPKMSYGALYAAAKIGCGQITAYLINKGANINALADDKSTPLYIAAQNGCIDSLKLLINAGASLECVFKYVFKFSCKYAI